MHLARTLALLLLPVLSASACRWSVPADPGENARLRSRPVAGSPDPAGPGPLPGDAQVDAGASTLYYSRCAQCHAPFAPATFTAGQWPMYVERYGPRAGLFGVDRARVLRWLQANAR